MSDSILINWIQNRYIKGKALINIQIPNSTYSHFWKYVMVGRLIANNLLVCGTNYTILWRNGVPNKRLAAICEEIRDECHKDSLDEGICAQNPTKFSISLWRIKFDILLFSIILKACYNTAPKNPWMSVFPVFF